MPVSVPHQCALAQWAPTGDAERLARDVTGGRLAGGHPSNRPALGENPDGRRAEQRATPPCGRFRTVGPRWLVSGPDAAVAAPGALDLIDSRDQRPLRPAAVSDLAPAVLGPTTA